MAKRPPRRISKEIFSSRILELETIVDNKKLSKLLGASAATVRRYRNGGTPKNKKVYDKINRLYSQKKTLINPETVEVHRKQIEKRSQAHKYGRVKNRYVAIFPDYWELLQEDFQGINTERLEELSEQSYVIAWHGRDAIPLEVQYMPGGDGSSLRTYGRILNLVGIATYYAKPSGENDYTGHESGVRIFKVARLLIPKFKKETSEETRHDILREYFIEKIQLERGYTIAYLGYFFKEGDEL